MKEDFSPQILPREDNSTKRLQGTPVIPCKRNLNFTIVSDALGGERGVFFSELCSQYF